MSDFMPNLNVITENLAFQTASLLRLAWLFLLSLEKETVSLEKVWKNYCFWRKKRCSNVSRDKTKTLDKQQTNTSK